MEAKTERGISCYLHYSKIIAKGEVAGFLFFKILLVSITESG